MALLRNCVFKLFKSNFSGTYSIGMPETSCSVRKMMCGSNSAVCHFMTACDRPSIGPLRSRSDSRSKGEGGKEEKNKFHFSVMFLPAIFKGFLSDEKQGESNPETDLVNHIKRSILLVQNGELEKAERLLHIALKMAQDLKHEKGVTYIYDTMANLAFESGDFAKAQKLFVEVLRRLISNGLPHNDMIVLNISLKIADTFVALGDFQKGEQGFLFCLEELKKKISTKASDEDTLVLYAQALDRYSLFLLQAERPNEAAKHMQTAIEVAEGVFGDLNNKVGAILLSDMGVIKTAAGERDIATDCFEKALNIANREGVDASVAVIMVNRGVALKESGILEEAKHWCEMGLNHALKEKNKAIRRAAEECLKANTESKEKGTKYTSI